MRRVVDIEVVKSTTTTKRDNFLDIKIDSIKTKTKNVTSVDVGIQHVDIIFLNKVIKDLIGYFKVGDMNQNQASQAISDLSRLSYQGSISAKTRLHHPLSI
jgi:hypothetical protein